MEVEVFEGLSRGRLVNMWWFGINITYQSITVDYMRGADKLGNIKSLTLIRTVSRSSSPISNLKVPFCSEIQMQHVLREHT